MNNYKRTIFSWSMYDFANQPFTTLVVTFIYGTYFATSIVPGDNIEYGTALWSRGISITAIVVAFLSPFMGAIADKGGYRKISFMFWTWICVVCSIISYFAGPGEVFKALFWFVLANIAFEMGCVFCNSYLPNIAPREKIGRISGYGWSFGYVGGLSSLVISLFLFVNPEIPAFGFSTENGENYRAINILCGVWLAIFSIPTFIWVKDSAIREKMSLKIVKDSYSELLVTFREIKKYKEVFKFLIARLLYNDGLITIFAFGGMYAKGEFGFTMQEILIFGIVLNVFAGIGAFLMGFLDDHLGGKKTIQISNIGLIIAAVIAVTVPNRELFSISYPYVISISGTTMFWFSGILIGLFSGPNQSSSRSLMARFTPKGKENEFFGFYAFSGKATAFIGPFLLGVFTQIFHSQRAGVAVVAALLLSGYLILRTIDEDEGIANSKK